MMDLMTVPRFDGGTISLSEDLTKEVLIRAPFEGLKRCRMVSKSWGSWLSQIEFNRAYMSRNRPRKLMVFPASDEDRIERKSLFSVPSSLEPEPPVFIRKYPFYAFNMVLVASFMGLVCLTSLDKSIVWNPSTGEGRVIEFPPRKNHALAQVSFGFGFDGVDFKLLRVYPLHRPRFTLIIEIFSLKNNIWKEIKISGWFYPKDSKCSFIIDRVLYWEGYNSKSRDTLVLFWFNLRNENHGVIPYPVIDTALGQVDVRMLAINDKIVAFFTDKSQNCLKSYKLELDGSWNRGFTIEPHNFLAQQVVGALSLGDVILCWTKAKEFYVIRKNVPYLVPLSTPDWSQLISYEESLIGVDSGSLMITEENLKYRVTSGSGKSRRRLVEKVYEDLICRRAGMIKALTADLDSFRSCCFSGEANQCLYGFTDQHWEVKVPDDQFGLDFPHPKPVFYLDRHLKNENNWLTQVSVESDSWLYSIAFYYIAERVLDAEDGAELLKMLNKVPPIYEVAGFTMQPTEWDEEDTDFA